MTTTLVSLRRLATLSVAMTLLAPPIAAAQSPEAGPSVAAPASAPLLTPAAFARLARQPGTDVAPVTVTNGRPRIMVRSSVAAVPARAPVAYTFAPKASWASRHKVALISIIAGVVALPFILRYTLCDDNCAPEP